MGVRTFVAAWLAAAAMTGCTSGTPASEALDGEPLAWDQIEGVEVVDEAVVDGSTGGLTGKPSYPTVTRHLVPADGSTPEELAERLIDQSVEQGWDGQSPPAQFPYRATKSLFPGRGLLLVAIHAEEPPARVVLTLSAH